MKKIFMSVLILAGIAAGANHAASAGDLPGIVGKDGAIARPAADFRRDWSHLGSWAALDKESGAHGVHDVYTAKETVIAFRSTGKFPDGAVIVKEIRAFKTDTLTTGSVAYAGDAAVLFVMVKDSTGRFEGKNPLWGKGWGWAMFKSDNPDKQVAASFENDCEACHIPAEVTDSVFLSGYPTLK